MMRVIVHNTSDGVSITRPSLNVLQAMTCGGFPMDMPLHVYIDNQIERRGLDASLARQWAIALYSGGCTEAMAMDLFRRRDVPADHTAAELWDEDEIPADRWFRDAWRRSHNGGPIHIDMTKAKRIQFTRVVSAHQERCLRQERELYGLGIPELERGRLRDRIIATDEPDRLKQLGANWLFDDPRAGQRNLEPG